MTETYIVTGASAGIGRVLCRHLAKRNKNVIAIARRKEHLKKLKNEYPDHIRIIAADLATTEGRKYVLDQISDITNIAGLVNNAASIGQIDYLENFSLEQWHQLCAINLDAPIFLTQTLIPRLTNGRIINITTVATGLFLTGAAGYGITKSALNTFTKFLSEELRPKNIFVTSAHPGLVDTDFAINALSHTNDDLGFVQIQRNLKKYNKHIDVEISAKFLTWLLLDAENNLYTGDTIGVYNQKYQPLWHNSIIPSPYPDHVVLP